MSISFESSLVGLNPQDQSRIISYHKRGWYQVVRIILTIGKEWIQHVKWESSFSESGNEDDDSRPKEPTTIELPPNCKAGF